ncbi:MAG: glycosyltransferase family 4 protein [Spirochaetes bacterium]|nr:glycosyltransferase family 4 protein [Spirochaetota bacterium]
MKIAIDCRHISSSGVGVYLQGILPVFLGTSNFFYLLGDLEKLTAAAGGRENAKIIECGVKPFSFAEMFFFPKEILKAANSCDLFFSPFFNVPPGIKIPVYTTIHDIIFPDMPHLVSKPGLIARNFFYKRAHRLSSKIFTVSEFSKSRILHHLGGGKPVIVTHSAIQEKILNYSANAAAGRAQKTETIVFAGNVKKHKGLDLLLQAFALLKNEGAPHKLVIIGESGNFRSSHNAALSKAVALANGSSAGDVFFTGAVSDEQLMEHISSAALLVQPSLYEGFCLPPLEALVLGTRALISDIPVLREIYGGFPVEFFKAGDTADLKEKMSELLSQKEAPPPLADEFRLKYTFEKTASKILAGF